MRRATLEAHLALHPECVLLAQLRQVVRVRARRILAQQSHHRVEERRLRPAQVVAARAVRHVPVGVYQVGKVAHHMLDQIIAPALCQSQHREVGIPIVQLAKTPAGHHVGFRQRQQRGILWCRGAGTRQLIPQRVDMLRDGEPFRGQLRPCGLLRQGEVLRDEGPQCLSRLRFGGMEQRQNLRRRQLRRRVRKGLAVGENLRLLHGIEQVLEQGPRRLGERGRRCRQQRETKTGDRQPPAYPRSTTIHEHSPSYQSRGIVSGCRKRKT